MRERTTIRHVAPARTTHPRHRWTRLLGSSAGSALLLASALASPAVAAPGDAIVHGLNGLPGTRIDVCLGDLEILSRVRYGRSKVDMTVAPGDYRLKMREAASGTCDGRLLKAVDITFEADTSYTVATWKPKRKVAVKRFVNDVSLPAADAVTLTLRHLAKSGTIDGWVWQVIRPASGHFFDPTFDDVAKGRGQGPVSMVEEQTLIEVYPTKRTHRLRFEFLWTYLFAGGAYQAYVVGTKERNFRVVLVGAAGVFTP